MAERTLDELARSRCKPCEGGVEPYTREQTKKQLQALDGWTADKESKRIEKRWRCRDFRDAMSCLAEIAEVAEAEGHHPDLHLESYRNVRVELSTHAIGGLSENDFILAAKIDKISRAAT